MVNIWLIVVNIWLIYGEYWLGFLFGIACHSGCGLWYRRFFATDVSWYIGRAAWCFQQQTFRWRNECWSSQAARRLESNMQPFEPYSLKGFLTWPRYFCWFHPRCLHVNMQPSLPLPARFRPEAWHGCL